MRFGGCEPRPPLRFSRMRNASTTSVEIETELLEELRAASPGKADRELIEDMAVRAVGQASVRRVRTRFGLAEDEALAVAVEQVHDARNGR